MKPTMRALNALLLIGAVAFTSQTQALASTRRMASKPKLQANVRPTFDPEQIAQFIPSLLLADWDGDGRCNLLEFALGTDVFNPTDNQKGMCVWITTDSGNKYLTMGFKQRCDATLFLQFIPEVSGDKQAWSSGGGHVVPLSTTPVDSEFNWVVVRDTVPLSPATPRFMRLSVIASLVGVGGPATPSVTAISEVWVGSSAPVQGNGGTGSKVSFFAQRMVLPIETAGIVCGLQGALLTDNNATWSDGQFGSRGVPAYVEFDNGWMADIADSSATNKSLTLAGGLGAAVAPGHSYRIHKHFTVASMFGTNNETGLLAGLNPSTADNILLLVPQTQKIVTIFYYNDGTTHGWMDATFAPADNYVIYPEQGVMVRRRLAGSLNVYLAGPVKTGPSVVTIDVGNNLVGTLKSATPLSLQALNLYTGDPTTGLASGLNPTVADDLMVVAPNGAAATYFYYKDPTYQGWLDASFNSASTVPINPGSAFFIRRKLPNAAFNWTIPAE